MSPVMLSIAILCALTDARVAQQPSSTPDFEAASVKLNTTYSFGLDDQEFVVAFETDKPADFLDLFQELREAKASCFTLRDTPMFTCRKRSLPECLDALG